MSSSTEPETQEDDMMSEEEQEEVDRSFLTPIFRLTNAEINKDEHGAYIIYSEGMLNQAHIDLINQKFRIRYLAGNYNGLRIELVRK